MCSNYNIFLFGLQIQSPNISITASISNQWVSWVEANISDSCSLHNNNFY